MNKNYSKSILSLLTSKFSTKFRLVLMVLFVVVTPLVSFGQTQIFTRSGTFTVPCDVTSITVKVWGAGGGGHNSNNYGGGGGAFAQSSFSVVSGNVYAITVGSGAVSGTGDNGGDSSFANVVVAKGGKGGSFENGGQASASTGDIKFNGGNGGKSTGNAGAGGGAGAGISSDGNSGGSTINNTAGSGGLGINGGGSGGNGGTNSNSGNNGASPGGGGGERGKNGGSSGGGGDGRVEIIYTSSIKAYCTPSYNGAVEPITNVTFAGINKTTSNTVNGTPALESFCDVATVTQGSNYPISLKGNTGGDYSNYITVYIDWDQDGVFGNNVNERYDIGIIQNSNGDSASRALLGNINVPAGALAGNTRMRVIKSFNNGTNNYVFPCSSNGWGQAEDYAVTVLPACVLPGNTITTASAVCANTPFTLSLQNTSAAAVSYRWQTSIDNATWSNVSSVPFFNTDFTSLSANSNVYGTATVTGNELVLTSAVSSQYGGYVIQSTPGSNINSFTTTFDYRMFDGGGADGMSLSYGSDVGNGQGGGEEGEGTGLIIKFDSYDNAGNTTGSQIRISYGGVQIFSNVLNSFNLRNTAYRNVLLSADENGFLSLRIGTNTIVSGLALPAGYLSSNKTNWKFKFSARTGGLNDKHSIDNLRITYLNSTFTTSQTVSTYYRSIVTCGGNTNVSIPVLVTIDPVSPKIQTIIHPDCASATGSVTLNSLPSAGTWTLMQSGTSTATITGTGISATVSGLAPGTYTFSVSIDGCSASNPVLVKIDSLQETVWNGAWSNGLPNSDKKLVFNANYSQTTDLVACSCEVTLGNVIVKSDKTLTLTNELKVSGGTLTFENNASLVQINEDPTINSGNITYQRETVTAVDKFDYTYWSSPVSAQTLYNASPNTLWDKYMSFDAVNNNWIQENSSKVMDRGVGYIIRGPQNHYAPNPIGTYRANFIGVPHNGTIPVSITATGEASYLLGNPYPSALDADLFLFTNKDVLDGTLYFWTHNTDIAPSGSHYIYDSDDYASYNLTGGVGTGKGIPAASDVNPIPTIPTGEIAAGQGFFATSIAPGTVNFTNTMRLIGNVNSQFFRSNSKSKKNASFDKNRLWLNFSNTEGAFKQTLIGYVTGATNEYERTFDGISFDGNTFVDFYSVFEDKNFVIQGRALPFLQSDQVPLGYKTTIAGTFTITIFQTDGFLTTQNVFLEDKILGIIHNLKESSYNFTTEKGVFNERFVLRYTDKTLGTGDFESQEKTIVVFKEKNELKIKSEFETMKRVTVFDLLGKKVFEETLKDVNEFHTSNITLKNQIVIVKVVLTNGQVVAKKVSY